VLARFSGHDTHLQKPVPSSQPSSDRQLQPSARSVGADAPIPSRVARRFRKASQSRHHRPASRWHTTKPGL